MLKTSCSKKALASVRKWNCETKFVSWKGVEKGLEAGS